LNGKERRGSNAADQNPVDFQQQVYFLAGDLQSPGDILGSLTMAMHAQDLGARCQIQTVPELGGKHVYGRLKSPIARLCRRFREFRLSRLERGFKAALDIAYAPIYGGRQRPGIEECKGAEAYGRQGQRAEDAQGDRHER